MKPQDSSEKAALDRIKVFLQMENERYLQSQPNVHKLLKAFMRAILDAKPENVGVFAYEFFRQSPEELASNVNCE
ncbi:unnamed protein product [Albugo candida]|uniref:RIIa domain-containing protein n=1 Tax=Albugo candida TaxID=65357 RepID=A0A024GN49_9STRA|nr:unnamed protein product [Albugo candida]|eukprot:CCI48155.1 unnamed protein product [Albugo candida]